MVSSYTNAIQNTAKCPHGNPVGACPICAGMGGGISKNRDKPRRAGEMSYNECLAEWHRMQSAQNAKNQAKIKAHAESIQALKENSLQNKIQNVIDKTQAFLDKTLKNIENLPKIFSTPIKFVLNNIIRPVFNFVLNTALIATKNIQAFFYNTVSFVNSVTEKLAMIFGEIKNFADSTFLNKTKKAVKTVLSLFSEGEQEETDEEAEKIKSRELKKILKSIFRIKRPEKEKNVKDKFFEHI